jgi:hypothetical protein
MRWEELTSRVDELVAASREPAWAIKQAVADVFTKDQAGYYYCPATQTAAIERGPLSIAEFSRCKTALARAVGADHVREKTLDHHRAASGEWVKVAYSPAVRRVGEALNFFPGTYPGGIPNHPSPLAAMLASAVVGGGLGYGTGAIAEKLLPQGYGKKLKRTGLLLGAALGASPAAAWAYTNRKTGHRITDPWPFGEERKPVDSPTADRPDNFSTFQPKDTMPQHREVEKGLVLPREKWVVPEDAARFYPDLQGVKLGADYLDAIKAFLKKADFGDFGGGFAQPQAPTPYDVNINHLGQTLWQTGASTPLMGAAMGTMYAAQQMPGARPGFATGQQLGQLAMNAGKDYATGLALGALVNTAIGTPFSAPTFGVGNAALGLLRAGVTSLFS